uniref:Uncharacterized protein n=1 Tax=Neospora caninum (strain Liverpool) TaxID=572307 RepID=F0JB36_NEOCL|nr:hypothetical protein, conserved [Neospora caninum Liverpool]CEL71303.1 TPA: hypothetical protein, conserved [Neospora caninum Liverpool]
MKCQSPQRHRPPSYRSMPSRQASRAALPQKSERLPEIRDRQTPNRLRSGGQRSPARKPFEERQGTTQLERQSTAGKPPCRTPSLARGASQRQEPGPPVRAASRSKVLDGDGSAQPPVPTARGRGSSSTNDRVPTKLSELTPEEKEEEKKRLQALVKEFAKEAVAGFQIDRIDEDTGVQGKVIFSMDRFLTTIDLHSDDNSQLPNISLAMEDLTGIFKGDDAAAHSSVAGDCDHNRILVLTSSEHPVVVLEAASHQHRDKVYTCLKILR